MTRSYYLPLDQHTTLTNYSVSSKGNRAVVKVEIVVTDADELAWLIRAISQAQTETKTKPEKPAKPVRQSKRPLALPYYGDRS